MGLCLYIVVKVFLFHTMLFPTLMNDVLFNFSSLRSSIYQSSPIEFHPSSSLTQNAEATKQSKNLIIHPVQPFVKLFLFFWLSNHLFKTFKRKKERMAVAGTWSSSLRPRLLGYTGSNILHMFSLLQTLDKHWGSKILFKYCSLARYKPLCILILLWNDPTSSSSRKYSIPNEERCLSIKYKDN